MRKYLGQHRSCCIETRFKNWLINPTDSQLLYAPAIILVSSFFAAEPFKQHIWCCIEERNNFSVTLIGTHWNSSFDVHWLINPIHQYFFCSHTLETSSAAIFRLKFYLHPSQTHIFYCHITTPIKLNTFSSVNLQQSFHTCSCHWLYNRFWCSKWSWYFWCPEAPPSSTTAPTAAYTFHRPDANFYRYTVARCVHTCLLCS